MLTLAKNKAEVTILILVKSDFRIRKMLGIKMAIT
jgi:hypothetical protein